MRSLADELYSSIQPIEADRRVTCWVKHCTTPTAWLVELSRPVLGTLVTVALCDAHLYDFETSTTDLP